jgi:hypothetical protein
MKKRNKKKSNCNITKVWPSIKSMKKDLFIDLEKQEIIRESNGLKLKKFILVGTGKYNKPYLIVRISLKGQRYKFRLHRLFFYWKHNYLPPIVDHIDRNPFNNKIENLRDLDMSGNSRNSSKRKNASSKYKGVSWCKRSQKWKAVITINLKRKFLGSFLDEDDAGQAYNDKIRELHLEEVSVLNDTPQERARLINLFNEKEKLSYS